jgi:hypothetical protein
VLRHNAKNTGRILRGMYAGAQSALIARRIISLTYQKSGAHPMGKIPTTDVPATDEVIDVIAGIEMQRREMEKEAGLVASCSLALRKLHELLDHEKESLQLRGPEAGHPGNVEAVTIEIERVKGLTVVTSRGQKQRAQDNGAGRWAVSRN